MCAACGRPVYLLPAIWWVSPPLKRPVKVHTNAIPNDARIFFCQREHKRGGLAKAHAFWPHTDTSLWLAEEDDIIGQREVLVVFKWVAAQKLWCLWHMVVAVGVSTAWNHQVVQQSGTEVFARIHSDHERSQSAEQTCITTFWTWVVVNLQALLEQLQPTKSASKTRPISALLYNKFHKSVQHVGFIAWSPWSWIYPWSPLARDSNTGEEIVSEVFMFATVLSSREDWSWCSFHVWTFSIPAPWFHVSCSGTHTRTHTHTCTRTPIHTHTLIEQQRKPVITDTTKTRIQFPAVLPWQLLMVAEKGQAVHSWGGGRSRKAMELMNGWEAWLKNQWLPLTGSPCQHYEIVKLGY